MSHPTKIIKTTTMTQTLTKSLAAVGEEISHELGAKMITDFHNANPAGISHFQIGRNILENILAQPGCVAIRLYNALNELGQETLVYTGVDANNQVIVEYVAVNNLGEITKAKGIVADRVKPGIKIDEDGLSWGLPE
jgi:hypothetical protein